MDFGFPEDKILGTFRTNCPGWKVKIKGAKCKVSWALRLSGKIYPYQLAADVGLVQARKEVVASQKNPGRIEVKCVECKNC